MMTVNFSTDKNIRVDNGNSRLDNDIYSGKGEYHHYPMDPLRRSCALE